MFGCIARRHRFLREYTGIRRDYGILGFECVRHEGLGQRILESAGITAELFHRLQRWRILRCAASFLSNSSEVRFRFIILFDGSPKQGVQLPVIRPVAPLVQSTAKVMYRGLFEHPGVADITHTECMLRDSALLCAICHTDRDGAASNDKLVAARMASLPEFTSAAAPVLCSDMLCGNHRNQLVDTAVSAVLGLDLVGAVYRLCLLLRMGAYWLGVKLSLVTVVKTLVDDAADHFDDIELSVYNLEWVDYMASNYKIMIRAAGQVSATHAEEADDSSDDDLQAWERTSGGLAWRQSMHDLVVLAPAPWYGVFRHSDCMSRAERSRKIIACLRSVMFGSLPILPCSGKWTLSGPATDMVTFMMLFHSLAAMVITKSFEKKAGETDPDKRKQLDPSKMEQAFAEQLDWHAVAGRRARLSKEFVEDPQTKSRLLMFSVCKEPLRYLTAIFLRAGAQRQKMSDMCGPPR